MTNIEESTSREKISWLVFIPAILSFIPLIGIPFGISALLWGISDWKIGGKRAVVLSSVGIFVTMFLGWYSYSAIGNLIQSPGADQVKANYSRTSLAFLVRYIEYYKLGHGHYPDSLDELKEKDITFKEGGFIDPATTAMGFSVGGVEEQQYYYEVSEDGQSYILFSVGTDQNPSTQDDVYPMVLDEYKSILGLRTKP